MPDLDDPSYREGYRQGLADGGFEFEPHEISPARRYTLATLTLVGGLGTAIAGIALASPKYRHAAGVLLFSGATLGAVFGAIHILVDKNPTTPGLRLRV